MRTLLAVALALLVGCGGDSTGPDTSTDEVPAALAIISGDSQTDTVGHELPEPLVVRVQNAAGGPIRGQVINFRVIAGAGSVFAGVAISDESGEARERWTLGTIAADTQRVEARAVDNETGEPLVFATFTAVGLPAPADGLTIVGDTAILLTAISDTTTIHVAVTDEYGNALASQPPMAWNSLNPAVASVSDEGLVTATGLGQTSIAVTSGDLSATAVVTVQQAADSLVLLPNPLVLFGPGDTATVTATVYDTHGLEIVAAAITWSSQNLGVADISQAGVVTAVSWGTTSVSASVTSGGQTVQRDVEVVVDSMSLSVETTTLGDGIEDVLYDEMLIAHGGVGGYAWSLAEGSPPLPPGLALISNGNITGVPTTSGNWTFVVQVTSGSQSAGRALSIKVNETLAITTTNLPSGVEGVTYEEGLDARGGDEEYSWSVTSGSLPPGLTLDVDGLISGDPTAAGDYTFVAQVASGDGQTASRQLLLTIHAALAIDEVSFGAAAPNVVFVDTLTATGGDGFYAWSLVDGSLPDGLEVTASGIISGTPSAESADSTWSFTVRVESGDGQTQTRDLALSVNPLLKIGKDSLPAGVVGRSYSKALEAEGGDGSFTWALATGSGGLPDGLTLAADGLLSGTPTTAGPATFTVVAVSGDGQAAAAEFVVDVFEPLAITTASLPNAVTGTEYSATLEATGGSETVHWRIVEGALPSGLALDSADATISGTPDEIGAVSFTVMAVSPGVDSTTADLVVQSFAPLVITTETLPDGSMGTAYTAQFIATGGDGVYSWASEGGLPSGLSLTSEGALEGTPTQAGAFTLSLTVSTGDGQQATAEVQLVVAAPGAFVQVFAGGGTGSGGGADHSCALTADGAAFCWGENSFGELGSTDSTFSSVPLAVEGGYTFRTLSVGGMHNCGITVGGSIACWGYNTYGQVGDGTQTNRFRPTIVADSLALVSVSAGGFTSCGVDAADGVYCWGWGHRGERADGVKTEVQTEPVGPVAVSLTSVSVGGYHACGLNSSGQAYCWGNNEDGQLGIDGIPEALDPSPVETSVSFAQIDPGGLWHYEEHTCALDDNGAAYCWGANSYGQLGIGSTTPTATPTAVAGGLVFESISTLGEFTCGVATDGFAYCWGRNEYGQLGTGSSAAYSATPARVADGDIGFTSVSVGSHHACGLSDSGEAFCWGRNTEGALGDTTRANRSTPVRVIGPS